MKKLVLVRHAKTETHSVTGKDRDRNLTQRGISDATKMAAHLRSMNIIPDEILSSDANRARQTTMLFADHFNFNISKVIWEQKLYLCPPSVIEDTIAASGIRNSCETLFIVAHNSGISEYAFDLSKGDLSFALPTCGVAIFELKNLEAWSDIYNAEAILRSTEFSKSL